MQKGGTRSKRGRNDADIQKAHLPHTGEARSLRTATKKERKTLHSGEMEGGGEGIDVQQRDTWSHAGDYAGKGTVYHPEGKGTVSCEGERRRRSLL